MKEDFTRYAKVSKKNELLIKNVIKSYSDKDIEAELSEQSLDSSCIKIWLCKSNTLHEYNSPLHVQNNITVRKLSNQLRMRYKSES